jgi:hypothetical protein
MLHPGSWPGEKGSVGHPPYLGFGSFEGALAVALPYASLWKSDLRNLI